MEDWTSVEIDSIWPMGKKQPGLQGGEGDDEAGGEAAVLEQARDQVHDERRDEKNVPDDGEEVAAGHPLAQLDVGEALVLVGEAAISWRWRAENLGGRMRTPDRVSSVIAVRSAGSAGRRTGAPGATCPPDR